MPIYSYECTNEECELSQGFEETKSMTDPKRKRCPKCRHKVEKIYYPAGIQFKGDGWYVTDYKGKIDKPKGAKHGEKRVSVKGSGVSKSPGQSPRWAQD